MATATTPFHVLVFSKTTGYRHDSIPAGIRMFETLAEHTKLFTITTSEDATLFAPSSLSNHTVIVLLQNIGDDIFSPSQLDALKDYVRAGGGVVAIHGAAAGMQGNEWYAKLIGASFDMHPDAETGTIVPEASSQDHYVMNILERTKIWSYCSRVIRRASKEASMEMIIRWCGVRILRVGGYFSRRWGISMRRMRMNGLLGRLRGGCCGLRDGRVRGMEVRRRVEGKDALSGRCGGFCNVEDVMLCPLIGLPLSGRNKHGNECIEQPPQPPQTTLGPSSTCYTLCNATHSDPCTRHTPNNGTASHQCPSRIRAPWPRRTITSSQIDSCRVCPVDRDHR
jgi:hypothetical protein